MGEAKRRRGQPPPATLSDTAIARRASVAKALKHARKVHASFVALVHAEEVATAEAMGLAVCASCAVEPRAHLHVASLIR